MCAKSQFKNSVCAKFFRKKCAPILRKGAHQPLQTTNTYNYRRRKIVFVRQNFYFFSQKIRNNMRTMNQSKRLGILGGSFDPVHLGHIALAQSAFDDGRVDEIVFVPAAQAPMRDAPVRAASVHRLKMLEIAASKLPFPQRPRPHLSRRPLGRSHKRITQFFFAKAAPQSGAVFLRPNAGNYARRNRHRTCAALHAGGGNL